MAAPTPYQKAAVDSLPDFDRTSLRATLCPSLTEGQAPSDEALLLGAVLEYAPVVLWSVDQQGVFKMLRGRGLAVLGLEPDELAGRSLFGVYADFPEVTTHVRRALAGEERSATVRIGDIYFDSWVVPLRDERNEAAGLVGVATVATERVRAESALLESEDRFSKAFHSSPTATVISRLDDGTFIAVNEAFLEMSALAQEDILGRSSVEMDRWVNPKERERLIETLTSQGSIRGQEIRFRDAQNEVHWVRLSAEIIELDGQSCMLSTVEDVTAQLEAEEALKNLNDALETRVRERTLQLERNNRLLEEEIAERKKAVEALGLSEGLWRSLVEHAPDYILLVSREGTVEFINRVRPNVTKEQILNSSIFDFLGETERPVFREIFDRVIRTGNPESYEVKTEGELAQKAWYSSRIAPVFRNGEVASVIIMSTDITRQREAEEALRQRQVELEHLSRLSSMGEMASIVAHELNNPLGAIANYARGCTRLLNSGKHDAKKLSEGLNAIAAQADRASATIARLRGFVLRREIQDETVEPRRLIREALALTESECRRRRVRIRTDFEAGLPVIIVDTLQVEQVLINLILNALEAMDDLPSDRREIVVRAARPSQETVQISVIDSGQGLPVDLERDIFDTFCSTKPQGLGMGLAISRSIVEAHEGKLWAERNSGNKGATFHLTLPVRLGAWTRD